MTTRWTRRRLLAGTAAGAALLPFVPRLEAEAGGAEVPKRLIVYFTPDGTVPSAFFPTQTGSEFELPTILQPLAAHQSDLVVLKGLDNQAAADGPGGGGHIGGMGAMLTGRRILDTGFVEAGEGYSYEYGFASGPSIDQVIAQELGGETAFRSIEASCMVDQAGSNAGRTQNRMTYAGSNQPVAPENVPQALFDRLFADLVLDDPAALLRLRGRRQSVIDVVREDLNVVSQRVGAFDRSRIEAHLDALRELEERLNAPIATCTPPVPDYDWNPLSYGDAMVSTWQAQMDLVVRALACDLTRVASLQWSGEGRGSSMPWLGFPDGEHTLSHSDDDDAVGTGKLIECKTFWASQLALLVEGLKAQPVGDGTTVFDHTVVLWCSGIGKGNSHANTDLPFLLLGNAGGAFATGRSLDAGGIPHNALLVSIAQAMGLDIDQFGDPVYGSGPVPGLA